MAKVVQTTDERVRAAVEKNPDLQGVFEEVFEGSSK